MNRCSCRESLSGETTKQNSVLFISIIIYFLDFSNYNNMQTKNMLLGDIRLGQAIRDQVHSMWTATTQKSGFTCKMVSSLFFCLLVRKRLVVRDPTVLVHSPCSNGVRYVFKKSIHITKCLVMSPVQTNFWEWIKHSQLPSDTHTKSWEAKEHSKICT